MSKKRAIVAYDGKVYIFNTDDEVAPATCLGLLCDDPLTPYPAIYFRDVKPGVKDYLDLKLASKVTKMFPSRCKDGKYSDIDIKTLSDTYPAYGQKWFTIPAATKLDPPEHVTGPIKYGDDLYVSRTDDIYSYRNKWSLRLANFTFTDPTIEVEYAPGRIRFIELCQKYQLTQIFRSSSSISFNHHDDNLFLKKESAVEVLHGTQDARACVVKRVWLLDKKYRSDFFYAATKLYSCSEHSNIVTIYETRFDGYWCNIAMERCTCNFVEFVNREKTENYHLLKNLIKEAVLGVVHLHHNGVIHGSIRPSNVLVQKYRTGVVARLGGLSRSRYREPDDETIHGTLMDIRLEKKKEGWYTRDLFGLARFIIDFETGNSFVDDDKSDDEYFNDKEQFNNDMGKLSKINGVAHNLVKQLLTYSITAVKASTHYYFWPRGTFVMLIQVISNRITGGHRDTKLEAEVDMWNNYTFGGVTWYSKELDSWLKAMTSSYFPYTNLSGLLRLIRNTMGHPPEDQIWKTIGASYNGFEDYINLLFPKLFNAVCLIAKNNLETGYFSDFVF